jgi:hypothetical protein
MRICLALCLSLFFALMPATAETGLLVERAGQPSKTLSPEQIAALKPITQAASFITARGEQNEWTGPLLWDVLGASGVLGSATPREQAHLAVRVTGADGYSAIVSVGEISPQFLGLPIQLADRLNGAPLADHALRLIVPGDQVGGRSVRDVVRIDVE